MWRSGSGSEDEHRGAGRQPPGARYRDRVQRARSRPGLERTGREIVHLEIGEPDFDTPAHITDAAVRAMRAGETHYCPAARIPEFREAIAEHLTAVRGIAISPERVLVGTGAKPFLFFGVLATCNPGDEVIYPDPGFPIYESAIRWAGATPVALPLLEERDFVFGLEDLEVRLTERTKLVILNSPQNPTGGVRRRGHPARGRADRAQPGMGALG